MHEIKFDGYRVQAAIVDGNAIIRTRNGLDWTSRFSAIADDLRILHDCILDGEIVALDHHGAPDFAALQAALSERKSADLVFFVFDLLFDRQTDIRDRPLSERKRRLLALIGPKQTGRIRYVEHFATSGDAVLKSACKLALEGIVSKKIHAPYVSGRSGAWTKAKCRAGHEVVIGGWATTSGRFRSLLVGVHRGEHFVYIGRVGTGFGEAKVRDLVKRLGAVEARTSPFTGVGAPKKDDGIHWTEPKLVAEIAFAGWTGDGMVRQASFKGLREDKPAEDVEVEKPAPVATATPVPVKQASDRKSRKIDAVVMGVRITHPDKSLWPDAGDSIPVSKIDLAN